MSAEQLNEREFELINIIGKQLGSNQRDLSNQMNLSLGQTNMLVRRLASKGYIRIMQLNKKKVQYLLTPQGISEKFRKSIKYTLNTINSIGLIKDRLESLAQDLYSKGKRDFDIYGESDLTKLIEMVFKTMHLPEVTLQKISSIEQRRPGAVLLIATEQVPPSTNGENQINLIEELAREYVHQKVSV